MITGTVGIIGAMAEEIERLHEHVEVNETFTKAGITYYKGQLHGKSVIYCKSGVGKVNAAVCTQLMIDGGADCVLFTGVAGALDPRLNIGDIVVSDYCIQHDMDVTPLGFQPGEIPYHSNSRFQADARLIELAASASERLFSGRCLTGVVLSGDQFIADRGKVEHLHQSLQGACAEMEGASVAQVCEMNGIPFVIIRSMSDKADGSAHVNFADFTVQASNHSYQIIDDMLKHM